MEFSNVRLLTGDITQDGLNHIRKFHQVVSMDTETTGLNPLTSDLSIIQISAGDNIFIIRHDKAVPADNLKQLLQDRKITKIFHNANFDLRFLQHHLSIKEIRNVICTKIAAKILFGIHTKTSLKDLLPHYLSISLDKTQQLSDWSQPGLTIDQINYAINDVRYLHALWLSLKSDLEKHHLLELAYDCFAFLPTQTFLENQGIRNIFEY